MFLVVGNCFHQNLFLGAGDQICHWKWGLNFAPKPNMVNPKIQQHRPFLLPPKVSGKLTTCNLIPLFNHWQISLPLLPMLPNAHIALRHRTQHLRNLHSKNCKHYFHHYLFKSSFQTPRSTPSYWSYETLNRSDIYKLSVYLGECTLNYSSKYLPSQNKVTFSWCQLCDVNSAVHCFNEGDVKIPNKKILLLTRCQRIHVRYAVYIST